MPFSFIEIEEKKSRLILFIFSFLIFFYFLTAWLILLVGRNTLFVYLNEGRVGLGLPTLNQTITAFFVALFIGLLHWTISTTNLIEKLSVSLGAGPIDLKDTYHQYFKNIVDEVSVAIGGRHIEPYVVPVSALNAFSLVDFNGNAVIGITEGLLSRLNRSQIEAVVGHEAAHIASGDCLNTTLICSLSEVYKESLSNLAKALRSLRGRGGFFFILVYLVLSIMNLLNSLLKSFISRQREYRADAVAVRLTRNPLGLAEALKLISRKWHGAGFAGENLESIFIVSPKFQELDDQEGFIPDLFSTHPPIQKRIGILLNMAHMDEKALDETIKNMVRVSPVAKAEFSTDSPKSQKHWFVFRQGGWEGPFALDDLRQLEGFLPTDWVRLEGQVGAKEAFQDDDIADVFHVKNNPGVNEQPCPYCHTELAEINYEGAPILKCQYCEGKFVGYEQISRILIREDKKFSQELVDLADKVCKSIKPTYISDSKHSKSSWVIDCPRCHKKMKRQFFVYSYPVEIDRCFSCDGIWFDKQELEILQYIYEYKDKFFSGSQF